MTDWLVSTVGALLVAFVLLDIFHTLWHPRGFGSMARRVVQTVWRVSMTLTRQQGSELAGPLGILATVATWAFLNIVGWALIYLPWMPGSFYFASPLKPAIASDVLSSLYLSLVTLATLGFGDITPAAPALRLATPLEALIGFVMLTAAISWMLQVYPALGRRRAAAAELEILAATGAVDVVENGDPSVAASILHSVTRSLSGVTVDLIQYAESYYFWERQSRLSLPANLSVVVELIDASQRSSHPEVKQAGATLQRAADVLADRLHYYVGGEADSTPTTDTFVAYARDHRHKPGGWSQ